MIDMLIMMMMMNMIDVNPIAIIIPIITVRKLNEDLLVRSILII